MYLPIKIGLSPTLKIRGIIATEDIEKGQIIERCPILILDVKHDDLIHQTPLISYTFEWNKEFTAIVLGYGSLYNHSYKPNAQYIHNYKDKTMTFQAIRKIKQGEEICINYNEVPTSKAKLHPAHAIPDITYNTKKLQTSK